MQLNARFVINDNSEIVIQVPDTSKKDNAVFVPDEYLHPLDIAHVIYKDNSHVLQLKQDVLDDVLFRLYYVMVNAINITTTIPGEAEIGNVGYWLNDMYHEADDQEGISTLHFRVWWYNDICTLIYSKNSNIYLEIIPMYPWILQPVENDEAYITFQEFMYTYRLYVFKAISREEAIKWKDYCHSLLVQLLGESEIPSLQDIVQNYSS